VARRRALGGAGARRVSRVAIYDCTLRDGMQGEGMSLSRGRSCASRTCSTSSGVPLIEAGFPASNPKEAELFGLLARETFADGGDRGLRHDPPARRRGRARRGLRMLADSFAPCARSSARRGACTWRRSCASAATRTSR
jgi:2-isopropylmalate synthase